MLRILDKDGNPLERNSMVFQETSYEGFLSITLRIKNESERAIVNPGIYLLPSSLDGDILSFSNKTPDSMLQEILLNEKVRIKIVGLYIPNDTYFDLNNGSRENNKIVIANYLNANEYVNIDLIFEDLDSKDAELLYIGLDAK